MPEKFPELLSDPFGRLNRQNGNAALQHEILGGLETIFELLAKFPSKLAISRIDFELQISLAHDHFS